MHAMLIKLTNSICDEAIELPISAFTRDTALAQIPERRKGSYLQYKRTGSKTLTSQSTITFRRAK